MNPRGGKVAAQDRAVRETSGEIVAFSDANATWAPDALRRLVANFADPEVAYVCGRLVLEAADGSNQEGLYWRYELGPARGRVAARLGDGRQRLDLRRPPLRLRRGRSEVGPRPLASRTGWCRRAAAPSTSRPRVAFEKPTPTNETEYRRKVRMFEHCWEITLRGSMLKRLPPGYFVAVVSHRVLRYGSGAPPPRPARDVARARRRGARLPGRARRTAAADRGRAALGVGIARYYVLVTWATVVSLWNYLRRGVPATWEPAEGTR